MNNIKYNTKTIYTSESEPLSYNKSLYDITSIVSNLDDIDDALEKINNRIVYIQKQNKKK